MLTYYTIIQTHPIHRTLATYYTERLAQDMLNRLRREYPEDTFKLERTTDTALSRRT